MEDTIEIKKHKLMLVEKIMMHDYSKPLILIAEGEDEKVGWAGSLFIVDPPKVKEFIGRFLIDFEELTSKLLPIKEKITSLKNVIAASIKAMGGDKING
jgi:hypothetical protein